MIAVRTHGNPALTDRSDAPYIMRHPAAGEP